MYELREKDTDQCGIVWKEFREFFKQRKESFFVCVVVVEQLLSLRERGYEVRCESHLPPTRFWFIFKFQFKYLSAVKLWFH